MTHKSLLVKLKKQLPFRIKDKELISLSLDISRISDAKITKAINNFKRKNNFKITSYQRRQIRDFILGKRKWKNKNINPIEKDCIISDNDKVKALEILIAGIKRNPENVFGTLKSRLEKMKNCSENNIKKYEKILFNIEKNKNQLIIIKVKPEKNLLNKIKSAILAEYDNLSNYHNLAIIFEDDEKRKIKWSIISKIAIFCEFLKKEYNFGVFNKQKNKKINELKNFILSNENIENSQEINHAIEDFYNGLYYGFQFNDLFISKSGKKKILILQKIELDETPYPCPDCMEIIVRGNSYSKLLQKSFECQNPNCPSRSKIGRGKRYDLLNIKRNLMLEIDQEKNRVPFGFARQFRRDIFDDNENLIEMLIRFYSWNKNNILIIKNDLSIKNKSVFFGRKIFYKQLNNYKKTNFDYNGFNKLLSIIIKKINIIKKTPIDSKIEKKYSVYNGNSSNILYEIKEQINGVITSPPYYNAREYSQWPTLICYLIDMAINAKSVFDNIKDKSYYFYNIGDIVCQDNVFVSSYMSNRRLMLGFYSAEIFEILGFNFIDNVIWDKGEVQSKRNSTENLFPGYIKPINCYEHILIFGKNKKNIKLNSNYLVLGPVKKINSKGENILGHTAPYPEELVKIIFPFLDKKNYLLDPFLGSGTTVIAGKNKEIKTVGIELDKKYYSLALNRIINQ